MTKNYEATKTGFTVTDAETGHILQVTYKRERYHGIVVMPEQGQRLPLEAWDRGSNPFEDDHCFEGSGGHFGDQGSWWFTIRPSAPFSQIMTEVESLKNMGFFKRLVGASRGAKLAEIAPKKTKTGYVFWDINDDLGKAADKIIKSSAEIQMAYGYARRSAVAAMYLQGLAPRDVLDHVGAVFKALQAKTGHTIEFQKQAFNDSIEFMQSYNPLITSLLVKTLVPMAREYEPSAGRKSDPDFFAAVINAAYEAQEDARRRSELG